MITHVLPQNTDRFGGPGGDGDYASPEDVPEDVIALFPKGGGSSIDVSDTTNNKFENQGEVRFVLGTADGPVITNPIDAGEVEVLSRSYLSVQRQVFRLDVGTVSSDQVLGFKIRKYDEEGFEPYNYWTFDDEALSGDTETEIIDKLINAANGAASSPVNDERQIPVWAGSDHVAQVSITNVADQGGQASIEIEGTSYNITWDTDANTTANNFVNNHGDEILAAHGVRVTVDASDNLDFAGERSDIDQGDYGVTDGGVIDLSLTEQQAKEHLRLEVKEVGDVISLSYPYSWEPTSVTEDTSYRNGSGEGEEVGELERQVWGTMHTRYIEGNGILGRLDDPPRFSEDGNQYHYIIIRSDAGLDPAITKSYQNQDILLALENDLTFTDINSFFANQGVSF